MRKKEKKKLSLDEYINIAKGDIYVYIIVGVIFFFVLIYIGYRMNWYYIVLLDLFMVFVILVRIEIYHNLKKIKSYLVENDLLDNIRSIDYWNEKNYFLTEHYMIIKKRKYVYAFPYSEIERIWKETNVKLRKNSQIEEFLHIVTSDCDFRILTWTNFLVAEELKDISDYLLKKNPEIKVDESI